jgi:hypothetical protein
MQTIKCQEAQRNSLPSPLLSRISHYLPGWSTPPVPLPYRGVNVRGFTVPCSEPRKFHNLAISVGTQVKLWHTVYGLFL